MLSFSAVILSAALLLAMILNLALKPRFCTRLIQGCMLLALIGGLIWYGTGIFEATGDLAVAVIRTPVMVLRMFLGINELSTIASSRLMSTRAGLFGFWLIHLMAFYSITSAVLSTLGAELLRQIRFFLSQRGDLTLIFGINENSVALGKECYAAGGNAVIFVADSVPADVVNQLNTAGMAVLTGPAASADEKSFRRLRLAKRKLTVYALDETDDRNLTFALRLKDLLEKQQVPPENTRVTLPGTEEIICPMLQLSEESYGFGYVNVFDRSMLAARALVRTLPPWELVSFGPDGRAEQDFSCVIAGFGSHGQAVLKQLVMNGQFAGAQFRAAVFSPNFEKEAGYLLSDCPELLKRYEISSFQEDARSIAFYRFIEEHLSTLKLIVVATGDEKSNREISDDLMLFLKRCGAENICVIRCGDNGVYYQEKVGSPILTASIFTRAFLSAEDADRGAILLNANYDTSHRSDWEKWVSCDSFSKMSSRASADFSPAFIRASGSTREALMAGEWNLSDEMLRNLGETEHLRWNAFHFAMGYRPMSEEEFSANAERWIRCREEGVPCRFNIVKNSTARTHACLIDWDELDQLSARVNEITGRSVDYKQLDINNVLILPKLLQAEKERRPEK